MMVQYCCDSGSTNKLLEPILFVLYIQQLPNVTKRHSLSVHLFAEGICFPKRPNKCTSLSIGHNVVPFSTTAKNHGFRFTDDMRIDAHVQDIGRKFNIDIQRISSIHHLLFIDAKKALLSAFVLPKLHHCNYLFYGSPMYMLERLHKVQNSATRIILQCCKQNHI